jgi:hypothetical protein
MRARLSLFLAVATISAPISAGAQAQRTAAALVLAEDVVFLNDQPAAASSAPSVLPDTAVVRTAQGRAAVALKRGGWLFLDAGASVRVLGNGVYNFNRLEVLSGSAIVASGTSAPQVECESEIRLSDAGFFRFDAQPVNARGERPCQFRVYEGAAAVPLTSVTSALRAGQMMTCSRRCGDMIPINEFSPGQFDGFDQWARRTHELLRR